MSVLGKRVGEGESVSRSRCGVLRLVWWEFIVNVALLGSILSSTGGDVIKPRAVDIDIGQNTAPEPHHSNIPIIADPVDLETSQIAFD